MLEDLEAVEEGTMVPVGKYVRESRSSVMLIGWGGGCSMVPVGKYERAREPWPCHL